MTTETSDPEAPQPEPQLGLSMATGFDEFGMGVVQLSKETLDGSQALTLTSVEASMVGPDLTRRGAEMVGAESMMGVFAEIFETPVQDLAKLYTAALEARRQAAAEAAVAKRLIVPN